MTIPEVRPYTLPYQSSGGLYFSNSAAHLDCGNDSSIEFLTDSFTAIVTFKPHEPGGWSRIFRTQNHYVDDAGYNLQFDHEFVFGYVKDGLGNSGWTVSGASRVRYNMINTVGMRVDRTADTLEAFVFPNFTSKYDISALGNISNSANLVFGWASEYTIYEAIFIAEALTQSEIRGIMEGRRLPTEFDCRLWLDFRQGHTRDLSGNGNHGTRYGGAYFV